MKAERNLVMDGVDVVAMVYASRNDNGEAERLARLFAAAPDMLEALKAIAKDRGPSSNDELAFALITIGAMKGLALAAIAKAEPKP